MEYNGGSVIAMVGKDCVAIASDLRLGNQALGISSNFQRVRHALNLAFKWLTLNEGLPCDRPYLSRITWSSYRCHNTVRYTLLDQQ